VRVLLRVSAFVLLAVLLIGVPVAVVALVGVPSPSLRQWRAAWTAGRVDGDFVIHLGAAVFSGLWLWFAVTALAEAWRVVTRRADPISVSMPSPGSWVRGLVRFVALSSLSAVAVGVVTEGLAPMSTHVVTAGVAAPDQQFATTPSATSSHTGGLGAAVLLSAGVLGALEVRRRRLLRSSRVGDRVAAPAPEHVRTEVLLRALSSSERVARLDVAVRSVARELAAQRASVTAVVLGETGEVRLFVRGSAVLSDPWEHDLNEWYLPASVPLESLAVHARESAHPCPALAHIGGLELGGELFVDLEAVGVLSVDSPYGSEIVRALAASMSISPFLDAGRVLIVGLDEALVDATRGAVCSGLGRALDEARLVIGSTATMGESTFSLRAQSWEPWEPAVVFAAVADDDLLSSVVGGRGLGVVARDVASTAHRLRFDGVGHVYEPLGLRLWPIGLDEHAVASVADLIRSVEEVLTGEADVVSPVDHVDRSPFVEQDWSLMVRVLGQVEVIDCDGIAVAFERSKALELVVWLAQHRARPTRTAARTALWDVVVQNSTFSNVVSEARRALTRAVPGEEWIARTLTEELPLHEAVVTDADLLAARLAASRRLSAADAIEVLRPGLELVTGLPFAGTSFLWSDAEGHTSSLVLLATGAATELANHYLDVGDIDGVFWATGQGLKVLSGHEELIALRMRAHAHRGDLSGVRLEWESYERSLAADGWAAAEPAPKLVDLRRTLLTAVVQGAG
jgi:hypothetical protein